MRVHRKGKDRGREEAVKALRSDRSVSSNPFRKSPCGRALASVLLAWALCPAAACAPSLAELRASIPPEATRPDAVRKMEGDWQGMAAAAERLCQPMASLEQRRLGMALAMEAAKADAGPSSTGEDAFRQLHLQAARCAVLVAELETDPAAMVAAADAGIAHAVKAGSKSALLAKEGAESPGVGPSAEGKVDGSAGQPPMDRTAAHAAYCHAVLTGLTMKVAGMGEAMKLLGEEVALLEAAQAVPEADLGGPLRILGFVLLKAPAWPAGPGDLDRSLELLEKAAALYPSHPLNHLILAQALAEDGREEEARASLARGMALADESVWGPAAALWRQDVLKVE